MKNVFEKAFGKKPKKGFKFKNVEVDCFDNAHFKGIDIGWLAQGIGFGHVTLAWGVSERVKKDWPKQYGLHADTECMSEEFVTALLIAAAPKLAKEIMKAEAKP